MIHRLVQILITLPLAVLIIAFSVANRAPVRVSLDPFGSGDTALSVSVPLFLLVGRRHGSVRASGGGARGCHARRPRDGATVPGRRTASCRRRRACPRSDADPIRQRGWRRARCRPAAPVAMPARHGLRPPFRGTYRRIRSPMPTSGRSPVA